MYTPSIPVLASESVRAVAQATGQALTLTFSTENKCSLTISQLLSKLTSWRKWTTEARTGGSGHTCLGDLLRGLLNHFYFASIAASDRKRHLDLPQTQVPSKANLTSGSKHSDHYCDRLWSGTPWECGPSLVYSHLGITFQCLVQE